MQCGRIGQLMTLDRSILVASKLARINTLMIPLFSKLFFCLPSPLFSVIGSYLLPLLLIDSLEASTVPRMPTRSQCPAVRKSGKELFVCGRRRRSGTCCRRWWRARLILPQRLTSLCTTTGSKFKATWHQSRCVRDLCVVMSIQP